MDFFKNHRILVMDYRFEFEDEKTGKSICTPRRCHFNSDITLEQLKWFVAGCAHALSMQSENAVKVKVYNNEGELIIL